MEDFMVRLPIVLSLWWIIGLILFLILNRLEMKANPIEACNLRLLWGCFVGGPLFLLIAFLVEVCEYIEALYYFLRDHGNRKLTVKRKISSNEKEIEQ